MTSVAARASATDADGDGIPVRFDPDTDTTHWYPGDGTAVEQAPGDPASLDHTFTFPGRYHILQTCYGNARAEGDGEPYKVTPIVDYGIADMG